MVVVLFIVRDSPACCLCLVVFPVTLVLIVAAVTWLDRRSGVRWRLRHGRCPTCGLDLGGAAGPCPRCEVKSRCRACGYDLRATPDRCPECGAVAGHRDG